MTANSPTLPSLPEPAGVSGVRSNLMLGSTFGGLTASSSLLLSSGYASNQAADNFIKCAPEDLGQVIFGNK